MNNDNFIANNDERVVTVREIVDGEETIFYAIRDVYADDSQVDLLITRRCGTTPGGRVEVRIHDLPLRRCLLCGGLMNPKNN